MMKNVYHRGIENGSHAYERNRAVLDQIRLILRGKMPYTDRSYKKDRMTLIMLQSAVPLFFKDDCLHRN